VEEGVRLRLSDPKGLETKMRLMRCVVVPKRKEAEL
jgi:hypothetical protein